MDWGVQHIADLFDCSSDEDEPEESASTASNPAEEDSSSDSEDERAAAAARNKKKRAIRALQTNIPVELKLELSYRQGGSLLQQVLDPQGAITPLLQELLQAEWEGLSADRKCQRRAERARQGHACSSCGAVGYFRRNCPDCEPVRYCRAKQELVLASEYINDCHSESTAPRRKKKAAAAAAAATAAAAEAAQQQQPPAEAAVFWGSDEASVLTMPNLTGDGSLHTSVVSRYCRALRADAVADDNVTTASAQTNADGASVCTEGEELTWVGNHSGVASALFDSSTTTAPAADADATVTAAAASDSTSFDPHIWRWLQPLPSHSTHNLPATAAAAAAASTTLTAAQQAAVHATVSGQQPGSYLQYRGAAAAQPAHSLQLVLDRLAAALQEQLEQGQRQLGDCWLEGILRSPVRGRGAAKDSFPAAVLAADAEYFAANAAASASARSGRAGSSSAGRAVKQHQYLGHIRCSDAQAYPFDKR
jgi:hypothetical protein